MMTVLRDLTTPAVGALAAEKPRIVPGDICNVRDCSSYVFVDAFTGGGRLFLAGTTREEVGAADSEHSRSKKQMCWPSGDCQSRLHTLSNEGVRSGACRVTSLTLTLIGSSFTVFAAGAGTT